MIAILNKDFNRRGYFYQNVIIISNQILYKLNINLNENSNELLSLK